MLLLQLPLADLAFLVGVVFLAIPPFTLYLAVTSHRQDRE